MKFVYISYTPYIPSLKVTFYDVLNNFVYETKFHAMECFTCSIMSVLKKFQILEHF